MTNIVVYPGVTWIHRNVCHMPGGSLCICINDDRVLSLKSLVSEPGALSLENRQIVCWVHSNVGTKSTASFGGTWCSWSVVSSLMVHEQFSMQSVPPTFQGFSLCQWVVPVTLRRGDAWWGGPINLFYACIKVLHITTVSKTLNKRCCQARKQVKCSPGHLWTLKMDFGTLSQAFEMQCVIHQHLNLSTVLIKPVFVPW